MTYLYGEVVSCTHISKLFIAAFPARGPSLFPCLYTDQDTVISCIKWRVGTKDAERGVMDTQGHEAGKKFKFLLMVRKNQV